MGMKHYFTINETAVSGSVSNKVEQASSKFVHHYILASAYNDKFKSGRKKIKDKYVKEWFKEEVSFSSFVDFVFMSTVMAAGKVGQKVLITYINAPNLYQEPTHQVRV